MIYLNLLLSALLPIALGIGFYFVNENTKFKFFNRKKQQIVIGIVFGLATIACTECGYYYSNSLISIGNTLPLLSGFLFSGPAGLIAASIGFIERLSVGLISGREPLTIWACSFDLLFSGIYAFLLRKFMFEERKPTWGFSIACTIVLETLCFTMIFLTNITNPSESMSVIKFAILPVFISSILSLFIPTIFIQFWSNRNKVKVKEQMRMSSQVQWWLLVSIVVCYLFSSFIIYAVQTNTAYQDANTTFNTTISDVKNDVNNESNNYLQPILDDVVVKLNADPFAPPSKTDPTYYEYIRNYATKINGMLKDDSKGYNLASIDIIDNTGAFNCSSLLSWQPEDYHTFNMNDAEQSKEINTKMISEEYSALPYKTFIQQFGKQGDTSQDLWKKYAAQRLDTNYYVAISISENTFSTFINEKVADITSYRHVNNTGHIVIMQYDGTVISVPDSRFIGKELEAEIKSLSDESKQYIRLRGTIYGEDSFYMYCFAETYKIVVVLPYEEVMSARDSSFILNTFMEIIVFAILYALIYFLIRRKVVRKIENINDSLGKIIDGDLYVKVNVNSSYEFASLSKDINSTVDRLKIYIKEAEKRIDDELAFAKIIQLNALPPSVPNFPGTYRFNLYATMFTAKEVGGDFYDYYLIDKTTLAFVVADVSGKGIPAAMFMMQGKAILKNLARTKLSVNEVMTKSNEALSQNNEANMFITCWLGFFDTITGKVTFANAGHTRPLIYYKDKDCWEYISQKNNMVLAALDNAQYILQEFYLKPGDKLYLYTDGVTEATRNDGELYGEQRLLDYLNSNKDKHLKEIVNGVKEDIDKFVEGADQFDDITMLSIEYKESK